MRGARERCVVLESPGVDRFPGVVEAPPHIPRRSHVGPRLADEDVQHVDRFVSLEQGAA